MKRVAKKPIIVVVSGPTGAGKTVIVERLLKKNRRFSLVFSVTTRPRGKRKKALEEYRFVSPQRFAALRKAGKFIETARVHGYWYATLEADLRRPARQGKIALKIIDVKGFAQFRRLGQYRFCSVFVTAESLGELKRRVIAREPSIAPERVRARLKTARQELKRAHEYDAIFINRRGELARTVKQIDRWIDRCTQTG